MKATQVTRRSLRKGVTIVKRGDVWYAEIFAKGTWQFRGSLYTSDAKDAERRAEAIASGAAPRAALPEVAPKPPPPAKLSLTTAYELYKAWYEKNKRASGARRALPVVLKFVDFAGAASEVSALSREVVQRFVDERRSGGKLTKDGKASAPLTVRNDFARIRAFLRWVEAKRPGVLQGGITRGIDLPKDDGVTASAPSVEEVKGVLRELRKRARVEWIADWWAVLCETGMRPSELLGARGIDLKGRLLSIEPWGTELERTSKGRVRWTGQGRDLKSKWSKRKIELSPVALSLLQGRAERIFDKSRPIFGTGDGTVYSENAAYHFMRDALAETQYKGVTPYDARHFFCSEHAAPGANHMNLENLAAYIGHSPKSQETLRRWYTDQDALRRGAPVSLLGDTKETTITAIK